MPDEAAAERAGRTPSGRLGCLVALAVAILCSATLTWWLPSSTGLGHLVLRGAVGLGVGGILTIFVWRALRAMTAGPPPSPGTVDARSSEVVYVCAVCGTRLRLEVAATGKAPKHCGEEMEPTLA